MRDRIIKIVESYNFTHSTITDESHLSDDLDFDSLDRVEVALDLEDEFDIGIPDALTEWKTVKDIIKTVEEKVNAK